MLSLTRKAEEKRSPQECRLQLALNFLLKKPLVLSCGGEGPTGTLCHLQILPPEMFFFISQIMLSSFSMKTYWKAKRKYWCKTKSNMNRHSEDAEISFFILLCLLSKWSWMYCVAIMHFAAQQVWFQLGVFLGPSLPSICDPCSPGQTTVCFCELYWKVEKSSLL